MNATITIAFRCPCGAQDKVTVPTNKREAVKEAIVSNNARCTSCRSTQYTEPTLIGFDDCPPC